MEQQMSGYSEGKQRWDIFLSHSSADKAIVLGLAQHLSEIGLRCWYDNRDIKIHRPESWESQIVDGIKNSDRFLLILTESSGRSPEVAKECSIANSQGRRPYVLSIEEASHVTTPLSTIEYHIAGRQRLARTRNNLKETADLISQYIQKDKLRDGRLIVERPNFFVPRSEQDEILQALSMSNPPTSPIVIALTGPHGAGKSILAEEICDAVDRPLRRVTPRAFVHLGDAETLIYVDGFLDNEPLETAHETLQWIGTLQQRDMIVTCRTSNAADYLRRAFPTSTRVLQYHIGGLSWLEFIAAMDSFTRVCTHIDY